ncbi:hypothetical protein [Flavobacterium sp.]|uniref:hypothetical protein n=1 Tax=Flavobacterium sp. TaxID=239 RepID=UPI0037BFB460
MLKIKFINNCSKKFICFFSDFGIPLGVAFGLGMKNMGLLSIGLPIGMGVGAGFGSYLDIKALNDGRQLNVEIKY